MINKTLKIPKQKIHFKNQTKKQNHKILKDVEFIKVIKNNNKSYFTIIFDLKKNYIKNNDL